MINNVTIMGRLTADPELRQTSSGVSTCAFSVAVDRDYVSQGQERQTDFISVVAWRQTAEFVSKYFSKGKMIAVIGKLRTRIYDDKRYPDVKYYVMELYADSVSFCGDKTASNTQQAAQPQTPAQNVQPAPAPTYQQQDMFDGVIGYNQPPF